MPPLNPTLPERIAAWIDTDGSDHALLLVSVDGHLRPHIMMLARDSVFVVSKERVRVAVGEASQSAENLRARSSATLAIYDIGLACTIKTHMVKGPRPLIPGIVAYDLAVEETRLDSPLAAEVSARLLGGLRFAGRQTPAGLREEIASLGP